MRATGVLWLVMAGIILAVSPAFGTPAEAFQSTGNIQGTVFLDLNQNGNLDDGEPPLGNMQLEISNGETILNVVTDAEGRFSIPVEDGLWRVIIHVPGGMTVINDATRQVNIGSDAVTQALMDFAVSTLNSILDGPQTWLQVQVDSSDSEGAILEQNPIVDLGEEPEEDIQDTGSDTDTETENPPMILPVSGSGLHPAAWMVILSAAVVLVGFALVLIGWRARGVQ